ncbi:MAG: thioredoxin-like domain-containing protein [Planctomycetota bacterium]|jgi:thiol-disulfide isomerase/thioredoxin
MSTVLASITLAISSLCIAPQDGAAKPALSPPPAKAPAAIDAKTTDTGSHAKIMAMFGDTLEMKDGTRVKTKDVIAGKKFVLLYFTASWCPPCRKFTPDLVKFAKENPDAKDFAIVVVTSDRNAPAHMGYMKKYDMPFYAVPFDASGLRKIKQAYGGSGIPNLVVLGEDDVAMKGSYETDGKYTPKNRQSYIGPQKVLAAFPAMRTKAGPKS